MKHLLFIIFLTISLCSFSQSSPVPVDSIFIINANNSYASTDSPLVIRTTRVIWQQFLMQYSSQDSISKNAPAGMYFVLISLIMSSDGNDGPAHISMPKLRPTLAMEWKQYLKN